MPARRAVLQTPSFTANRPLWSYHHTGTLPPLISFVSHSYKKTGGVGTFRNSLAVCRGFDPGNERLSKSYTACCQLLADHRSLTFPACPDPVGNPSGFAATLALNPLAATLMDIPQVLQAKDLRRPMFEAKPFRCNTYRKPGGGHFFDAQTCGPSDVWTRFRSLPSLTPLVLSFGT